MSKVTVNTLFRGGTIYSVKTFLSLFVFLFLITFTQAALTNSLPIQNITISEWKVIHTTDIGYTPFLQKSADKKTTIGLGGILEWA